MEDKYSVLNSALTEAKKWLNEIGDRPVSAKLTFEELSEKIRVPLNRSSIPPEDVVKHIVDSTKDGLLGSAGGRFFEWVIGGSVPSALASDWLVSTWDQNSALYACSPATSIIEETAGGWILD